MAQGVTHVGHACTHDGVRLVGADLDGLPEGFSLRGHGTLPRCHLMAHGREVFLGKAENPFGTLGPHREKRQVARHIERLEVIHAILAGDVLQVLFPP